MPLIVVASKNLMEASEQKKKPKTGKHFKLNFAEILLAICAKCLEFMRVGEILIFKTIKINFALRLFQKEISEKKEVKKSYYEICICPCGHLAINFNGIPAFEGSRALKPLWTSVSTSNTCGC